MKYTGRWTWERLFSASLVLNCLWIVPNFMNRMGLTTMNFAEISSNIRLGLSDPGLAYLKRQALEGLIETRPSVTYLTILASPFLQLFLPLGITHWRHLLLWQRILLLLWAIADIFTWIASGTNKGIADLLFLVPFFIVSGTPAVIQQFRRGRLIIWSCMAIAGFYGFLTFFSSGMSGRPGSASKTMSDYSIGLAVDESNFVLRALPGDMRGAAASLSTYLTQGYYGLSLCLEEPFIWTYGIGHSYYLPSWYKRIDPDSDVAALSYPGRPRVDRIWPYFHRWHSIYPWLASDVTFPGALLVMFFVGRLFSKVWLDILWCKNPIAICLFASLLIMLFYIPANNQVLGFPTSAAAFWYLLIWWWRTRQRAT
jgi:hypothetical protein